MIDDGSTTGSSVPCGAGVPPASLAAGGTPASQSNMDRHILALDIGTQSIAGGRGHGRGRDPRHRADQARGRQPAARLGPAAARRLVGRDLPAIRAGARRDGHRRPSRSPPSPLAARCTGRSASTRPASVTTEWVQLWCDKRCQPQCEAVRRTPRRVAAGGHRRQPDQSRLDRPQGPLVPGEPARGLRAGPLVPRAQGLHQLPADRRGGHRSERGFRLVPLGLPHATPTRRSWPRRSAWTWAGSPRRRPRTR